MKSKPDDVQRERHDDKNDQGINWEFAIEITAAFLLAVAVICTSYSAWQATRWSGVQAVKFAEASTLRTESAKAQSTGIQELSYDAITFVQLATLVLEGETETARIIADRFMRKDFQPFAEEWLALKPLENPDAPRNPFELKDFKNKQIEEAKLLAKRASENFKQAKEANQTGDNYILATVFFATVLFFSGLISKLKGLEVRIILLALACIGLVIGVIRIATLPFY